MEKSKILEITLAVYRLTEKFPAGEPLKSRIRNLSLDVLGHFVSSNFSDIIKPIQVLTGYFLVAKKQGWVAPVNFDILSRAYNSFLHNEKVSSPQDSDNKTEIKAVKRVTPSKKERWHQILQIIKKSPQKNISSSVLAEKMPEIGERTIRNDLKVLEQKGFLKREGETHQSIYIFKKDL